MSVTTYSIKDINEIKYIDPNQSYQAQRSNDGGLCSSELKLIDLMTKDHGYQLLREFSSQDEGFECHRGLLKAGMESFYKEEVIELNAELKKFSESWTQSKMHNICIKIVAVVMIFLFVLAPVGVFMLNTQLKNLPKFDSQIADAEGLVNSLREHTEHRVNSWATEALKDNDTFVYNGQFLSDKEKIDNPKEIIRALIGEGKKSVLIPFAIKSNNSIEEDRLDLFYYDHKTNSRHYYSQPLNGEKRTILCGTEDIAWSPYLYQGVSVMDQIIHLKSFSNEQNANSFDSANTLIWEIDAILTNFTTKEEEA